MLRLRRLVNEFRYFTVIGRKLSYRVFGVTLRLLSFPGSMNILLRCFIKLVLIILRGQRATACPDPRRRARFKVLALIEQSVAACPECSRRIASCTVGNSMEQLQGILRRLKIYVTNLVIFMFLFHLSYFNRLMQALLKQFFRGQCG